MKRKSKWIALMLSSAMLIVNLAGCGNQETPSKESDVSANITTSNTVVESSVNNEEKEIITVKHLAFKKPAWQENFNNYQKDSAVYKEFVKQTGVEIEEYGLDEDQLQVRIASGDLGDLISIYEQSHINSMVESELLLPLNDLIEQYAPSIIEECPERWEAAKTLYANEEGLVYALPIMAGNEGTQQTNGRYLYTVRWDLYEELGYPEMKNPEDLIEVLGDMMELQPTTPEGKKVYGASFYVTNESYYGMIGTFAGTYGFFNERGYYINRNVQTGDLVYDFVEENSPYWLAVDYYNKAYRAGILDPDCFTQQAADFNARIKSGELICPLTYDTSWEVTYSVEDPTFDKGYANVPVEGCMFYQNANQVTGWIPTYALCIPKTCENPERVAEMLAYTFSDEGSRMLQSGVEGVHWDYVNGVPTYNEETFKILTIGGEEKKKTGIDMTPLLNLAGKPHGEIAADGYHIGLRRDDDYLSRVEYSGVLTNFCEYYDVSWPNQIFLQWKDEGKMYDLSGVDFRYRLDVIDEDIARIDAACLKIAIQAIPKLVTAASDAEFEAVKADVLKSMEAAGAYEAQEFYTNYWNELRAKYEN